MGDTAWLVPDEELHRPLFLGNAVMTIYCGDRDLSLEGAIEDKPISFEGQPDIGAAQARLFAESERRFFLKATNGEIEFIKGDEGDVSYFLFYTGEAPRLAIRK